MTLITQKSSNISSSGIPSHEPPTRARDFKKQELHNEDLSAWVDVGPASHVSLEKLAVTFASTTQNQVETLIDGPQVYPRILADLSTAQSSIRIVQFGFKDCKLGRQVADILMEKARAGVDVQVAVSSLGSRVDLESRRLYREMAAAGVKIVANVGISPLKMQGMIGRKQKLKWNRELHCFEHRKIIVVDSKVAYTGGMGFEDHFATKMHDIMVRFQGSCVQQFDALSAQSFQYYLGSAIPQPATLASSASNDAGSSLSGKVTLIHNVPGIRWYKINEALFKSIDGASDSIWVMNPYIGDPEIKSKLCAAAQRGVKVRAVFCGSPENPFAKGKQRAQYNDLLNAGVEIFHYPTLLHAKVLLCDNKEVYVGSMNLDNLSTSRNFEVVVKLEDPKDVDFYLRELFQKDLSKCTRKQKRGNNVFMHAFDAMCGRVDNWLHA